MIELDVMLSRDREIVVIHDATLERTTNGQGAVRNYKLEELKRLDAGSWFGPEYAGQKIPTLTEVFELVGQRLLVNVELKGSGRAQSELPAKVVEIARRFSLSERVIFSSYNPWQLRQIGSFLPSAKLGLLLHPGWLGAVAKVFYKPIISPWAYHPHYKSVTPEFFKRAALEERPVLAYTVNRSADIRRLCRLGICGIITDDPVKALALRSEGIR